MEKTSEILKSLTACGKAVRWAKEKSIKTILKECDRGDWLLWLAKKLDIDIRKLTLAKARTAKLVIHLAMDERSINAVNVAERYGLGKATKEELQKAASVAASAAAYADPNAYAYAASTAAYAAYTASVSTSDASVAASASAWAYADAYADAYAAYAAKNYILLKSADICRELLSEEIITAWNKLSSQ